MPYKTFLFSDIEGSTRLWESETGAMASALRRHDSILRSAIEQRQGRVFKTVGDGFYAEFDDASSAVNSAIDAQLAIAAEAWPTSRQIRVRMALHSGYAEARDGDFFGPTLNRLARLLATGHGGQILLSEAAAHDTAGGLPAQCHLSDLGRHRLSDLQQPESISMVIHPDLVSEFPALKSLDSFPNNLPRHLSTFVGRQAELDKLSQLLDSQVLVTLAGSGGTGKSRLALQGAAENLARFPNGVWLVELASVPDGGLVGQSVASALGVRESSGLSLDRALSEHLRNKSALLVLDNCEHLVEDCARFAEFALRDAPKLKILATSREPLGVPGEAVFRVPSLPLPGKVHSAEEALESDSVRLLVERARLLIADFKLTDANAVYAANICKRLDGIPFAIELAASRMRVLSLQQIADRLNDQFSLLTSGSRTALPRQQTLRAMMDWSHNLLEDPDKTLLRRLAVFSGGWTLEAAEDVCSDGALGSMEILDSLERLVDKSLIVRADLDESSRYRMLETVKQYAAEKIVEAGEDLGTRERHAAYFARICQEIEPQLTGPDQIRWLDTLDREHDNIRASLKFARDHPEHIETGLAIVGAIGRFWTVRGFLTEGRSWIDGLLQTAGDQASESVATACRTAGQLAYWQGDSKNGRRYGEMSLKVCQAMGDRKGETISLFRIGFAALSEPDLPVARESFEKALKLGIEIDDQAGIPHLTNAMGEVSWAEGKTDEAKRHFVAALELFEKQGDRRSIAGVMKSLAMVACEEGSFAEANRHLLLGLEIRRELQNTPGIAITLDCLGVVAARQKNFDDAAILFGAADALHREYGSSSEPSDATRADLARISAHQAMGEERYAQLLGQGQKMSIEEMIEFANRRLAT